jgi:ATP-grasp domain
VGDLGYRERDLRAVRILVVISERWELGARFAAELGRAGFSVGVLSPSGNLARHSISPDAHYLWRSWARERSLISAIEDWRPQFLLCADDHSVRTLLRVFNLECNSRDQSRRKICELIDYSVGNPGAFAFTEKSEFMALASSLGVRCPKTMLAADEQVLNGALATWTLPAVIKKDGEFGGMGVRIVRTRQEARQSFIEMRMSTRWPRRLKRTLGRARLEGISQRISRRAPNITLQEYISGRPATRAIVCWKGETLAGISAEVLEVAHETGPATVVRIIEHAEMTAFSRILARRLGITGFLGFDFIIDPEGRPWLLEVNPRITPICHIVYGVDLIGALYARLADACVPRFRAPVGQAEIALFPHELLRDSSSKRLQTCFHDVPWGEPALVRACLKGVRRPYASWRFVRSRFRDKDEWINSKFCSGKS